MSVLDSASCRLCAFTSLFSYLAVAVFCSVVLNFLSLFFFSPTEEKEPFYMPGQKLPNKADSAAQNSVVPSAHASLSATGISTKTPKPPAASRKPHDSTAFLPLLGLLNDPATAQQYERHAAELDVLLGKFKGGFTPSAALDGVPQLFTFMTNRLSHGGDEAACLGPALSTLMDHCVLPIVCTTLEDQRNHDSALTSVIESLSLVLSLPSRALRLAAVSNLRKVFNSIRMECNDDINPGPSNVFHKKKAYQKSVTKTVLTALLEAWRRSVEADKQELAELRAASVAKAPAADEDEDDSIAVQQSRLAPPEIIGLLKALVELSHYAFLAEDLVDLNMAEVVFNTLNACDPGDRRIYLCIELLWNVLALVPKAAEALASEATISSLHRVLLGALQLGYKQKERELRNDVLVVLGQLANHSGNIPYFANVVSDLLDLSCGSECNRENPLVCKTYHYTTRPEELQMKKLAWTLIEKLCSNADFAKRILDWGFINVLLQYVNVHCDIPSVVRWSTLQLLDIQATVLELLAALAVVGHRHFSASKGASIVHEYLLECPVLQLRNAGVAVLARIATTETRNDLIAAGMIPLAIHMLEDTKSDDLRVECLNLLADTTDRDPALQAVFLDSNGVRAVMPLLTISHDSYTELGDAVTFAAVDCIWSCVVGRKENELAFLELDGINAIMCVVETCPPWMLGFPLSALADLLLNEQAVMACRRWLSAKSSRSAVQVLLSQWRGTDSDVPPAQPAIAQRGKEDDAQSSDSSVDGDSPKAAAPSDPAEQPASHDHDVLDAPAESDVVCGLKILGSSAKCDLTAAKPGVHLPPNEAPATVTPSDENEPAIVRVGLVDIPQDIRPIVSENSMRFKVFACMSLVGFDDHRELSQLEKATLASIEAFVDLCKDEVWGAVSESLNKSNVEPIRPDQVKLQVLREAAEERSQRLQESQANFHKQHHQDVEEAQKTFFRSLIKKTEEKHVVLAKSSGLTITQAKIRKGQMLKQSFKQTIARQQQQAVARETTKEETEAEKEALRKQQEEEAAREAAKAAEAAALRWGHGQRAMTDEELGILHCLDELRTKPSAFVVHLQEKLKYLNETGDTFRCPDCDPERCVEGAAVYNEAIQYLQNVRPIVTLLDAPMGMLYAARDHIDDLSRRMEVSPEGVDGSTPIQRLTRYGRCPAKHVQMMALGQDTAVGILTQLLVDDGVPSRIDRKNIFDPDMRVCGVSLGPHSIHQSVCIILLAFEYTDNDIVSQKEVHAKFAGAHSSAKMPQEPPKQQKTPPPPP